MVAAKWSPIRGDRRQEPVFTGIGIDMEEAEIRRRLDACPVQPRALAPMSRHGTLTLVLSSRASGDFETGCRNKAPQNSDHRICMQSATALRTLSAKRS